ncbi:MAG: hypothetical protein ACO395_02085 [Pontimonas sp.]|jgi:hypothetical protein
MDKVKLYPQERIDLDDTRALQSLIYDYIGEALGALWGHGRGVLSAPTVTTTENNGNPYITFSPFTFITSVPVDGRAVDTLNGQTLNQFKAIVVNYDPSEESAPNIELGDARATFDIFIGIYGALYLWARPVMVDTDTASRRKWDVASGAEVTFSDTTRTSQRCEFRLLAGEPGYDASAGEAKWAKIGELTGFSDGDNPGSVAQFEWISAFDDSAVNQFLANEYDIGTSSATDAQISVTRLVNSANRFPYTNGRSYRTAALAVQLAAIRRQLALIGSGGLTDPTGLTPLAWDTNPILSLSGAESRIRTLEQRAVGSVQCIASGKIGVLRSAAGLVEYWLATYVGPSFGVDRSFALIAPQGQAQNRVNIRIDNAVLAQGWAVTHVDVTQIVNKKANAVDPLHYDYNRVTFMVDPKAYSADSSDTDTMRIDTGGATSRGVTIEVLPQIMDDGGHSHSETEFHAPDGVDANATEILRFLTGNDYAMIFSFAVYAAPSANAQS